MGADQPPDRSDPAPAQPGLTGRDLIGLGGMLVGGVVVGLVVGLLLDKAFGTDPLLTIIGIFLGIVAAAGGFVARARAALRS